MFIELSNWQIILANFCGIPLTHFLVSFAFTKLPSSLFPDSRDFSIRARTYEEIWFIRRWKQLLPDAAPWFGGFAKGKLESTEAGYLREFLSETRRGEAAHWAQVLVLLSFLLWTPWPLASVIVVYAFLSNLPCLLLQRYNRARISRLYFDKHGE